MENVAKTVLVTGAAGFIGSHVSKALLQRGDRVVGIDNINNYYDVSLKIDRVADLVSIPNFKFIRQGVEDVIDLGEKVDVVCHLAGQAGVRHSFENPLGYAHSNIVGTLNVLEFAKRNGIKPFVLASTSSIYGNTRQLPAREEQPIDSQESYYATTKRCAEVQAKFYSEKFGLNVAALRFFTVYGPWGRPDMAYFKFARSIANGEPIDVYNHGDMKRDFTYIDDIVSGVVSSLDKAHSFSYEAINLARGEQVTLIDFIREIERSMGRKARINNLPMQQGDVLETYGDISKARQLLGYDPKTSVPEGIGKFAEWFKAYYNKS